MQYEKEGNQRHTEVTLDGGLVRIKARGRDVACLEGVMDGRMAVQVPVDVIGTEWPSGMDVPRLQAIVDLTAR
jgi:hypothetical protein